MLATYWGHEICMVFKSQGRAKIKCMLIGFMAENSKHNYNVVMPRWAEPAGGIR